MLKKHWTTLALIAIAVVPIAAYSIGYYACGRPMNLKHDRTMRIYSFEWQARIFSPLARMESWLTGWEVRTGCEEINNNPGMRSFKSS